MSFSLWIVIADQSKRRQPGSCRQKAHSAMHEQTWALGLHSCRALSSQLPDHSNSRSEMTKHKQQQ